MSEAKCLDYIRADAMPDVVRL